MRSLLIFSASALLAAAQQTSPTGFGRMMYPGTGGPTAPRPGVGSTGGAGFGRAIYPGTGAPYVVRPGVPNRGPFTSPPIPPHQTHSRSAIIPFPVFYGAGYYDSFDVPTATTRDDRNAPVVIINQNFRPEPVNPVLRDYSEATLPPAAPRPEREEIRVSRESKDDAPTIIQIAMTDGSIFDAVGYWVEGDTLHYLTVEGNNNLATLDLVDRERSLKLNQERKVEFKLPKR